MLLLFIIIIEPDFEPDAPLSTQTYQSIASLNDKSIHKMLMEYFSKTQSYNLSLFTYKQCIRKPSVFSLLLPPFASFINILNTIRKEKNKYNTLFISEITSIYYPSSGLKNLVEKVLNIFEVFDITSIYQYVIFNICR